MGESSTMVQLDRLLAAFAFAFANAVASGSYAAADRLAEVAFHLRDRQLDVGGDS